MAIYSVMSPYELVNGYWCQVLYPDNGGREFGGIFNNELQEYAVIVPSR